MSNVSESSVTRMQLSTSSEFQNVLNNLRKINLTKKRSRDTITNNSDKRMKRSGIHSFYHSDPMDVVNITNNNNNKKTTRKIVRVPYRLPHHKIQTDQILPSLLKKNSSPKKVSTPKSSFVKNNQDLNQLKIFDKKLTGVPLERKWIILSQKSIDFGMLKYPFTNDMNEIEKQQNQELLENYVNKLWKYIKIHIDPNNTLPNETYKYKKIILPRVKLLSQKNTTTVHKKIGIGNQSLIEELRKKFQNINASDEVEKRSQIEKSIENYKQSRSTKNATTPSKTVEQKKTTKITKQPSITKKQSITKKPSITKSETNLIASKLIPKSMMLLNTNGKQK